MVAVEGALRKAAKGGEGGEEEEEEVVAVADNEVLTYFNFFFISVNTALVLLFTACLANVACY